MDEIAPTKSSPVGPKLNRSCEACRTRKIRCHIAGPPGTSKCERCAHRGLPCIFAPVSKRRRRINARIQELERKIEALLPAQGAVAICAVEPGSSSTTPLSTSSLAQPSNQPNQHVHGSVDIFGSALSSISKAADYYEFFFQEMVPHYPAVFTSLSAEATRLTKPSLFLSIIAAAAASLEPDIAPGINQQVERWHADKAMIAGEKSLDLAEALIVSAIWNYPPSKFDALKFGRYAQMAADILEDIQLPQKVDAQLTDNGELGNGRCDSQLELVGSCRTLVACFLLCSSIALSFRRLSAITFTNVIRKCIAYLKRSVYTGPYDYRLAVWAEMQHRAENISGLRATHTSHCPSSKGTDFQLSDSLAGLNMWINNLDKHHLNESMTIHYHYIRMYAHEQTLYHDHPVEDFKPPYLIRNAPVLGEMATMPDYNTLVALDNCLDSGRILLDTFLEITTNGLRTVPVIVYTRMFYAIIVFAKLYVSAQSLESRFVGLVNAKALSFDAYVSRLINALHTAQGTENFRVPKVFLGMLQHLSRWCITRLQLQLENSFSSGLGDEWEPMRYADVDDIEPGLLGDTNDVQILPNDCMWMLNVDSILSCLDE